MFSQEHSISLSPNTPNAGVYKKLKPYKAELNNNKEIQGVLNCAHMCFHSRDEVPAKECSDRQRYFLMCASKLAMKSCMTHKHGCVIVVGDEIIATGFNHHFTHMSHKFSLHAEMHAIHKMKRKYKHLLSDCELYVVRIAGSKMDNCLKYSKPCPDCSNEIKKCGIRKVYYSTNYEYERLFAEKNMLN